MRNTRNALSSAHSETTDINNNPLFISKYYPINFIQSDRYVFFSSLLQKPIGIGRFLGTKANTVLYGPMRNPISNFRGNQNQHITQALDFLRSAAILEKRREEQFIQYYTDQHPELKKLLLEYDFNHTSGDQYLHLINKLNLMLKGYDKYLAELTNERQRIADRREIKRLDEAAARAGRGVKITDTLKEKMLPEEYKKRNLLNKDDNFGDSVLNPWFNMDANQIFSTISSNRSNMSILTNAILTQYGTKIFSIARGRLQLNPRQIDILIARLVQELYNMIKIKYKEGIYRLHGESPKERIDRIKEYLEELLKEKGEFNQFLDSIIEAPDVQNALTSLADAYGLPDYNKLQQYNNTNKVSIGPLKRRLKEAYLKEKQKFIDAGGDIKKWDKFSVWAAQNGASDKDLEDMIRSTQNLKVQCHYTNEGMVVTDLLQHQFSAILNGDANVPTDVEGGFFVVKYSNEITSKPSYQKGIQEGMFNVQQEAQKNLTLITDLDSFKNNTRQLKSARDTQEYLLKSLEEDIIADKQTVENILTHINIHGTVKGYASIDAVRKSFEGAAFGSNIEEQVKIINEMMTTGGITIADTDWLILALINCGQGMIGYKNKSSLEDYLSAFVGLLMFSDAALIAEDVKRFAEDQYISNNIQDIHLYILNNIYVPNSYILSKTYEHLAYVYGEMDADFSKGRGTSLTLTTFNNGKTSGYTYEELNMADPNNMWNQNADEALEKTKLTMTFMAHFLDLLDDLERQLTKDFQT